MESARKYRIHEVLGRGGFGTVYRGELLGAGGFVKAVAVKVLNADVQASDDIARRLRDEARLLGLLQHRSIVGVDGMVDLGGRWAVIMEYVDGADLGACLKLGTVPPGPALQIIQEVAAGLHAAWSRSGPDGRPLRLLHRDIKPGNIRITRLGEVKILDFGIARAEFDGRESETRSMKFGSLNYMAPERMDLVDGEDSHKSDVYALGVTLVEALTGEGVGKASLKPGTHNQRVKAAIDRVRKGLPAPEVLAIIADCLEFDEDDRPDARELEKRLRYAARAFEQDLVDWSEDVVPTAQRAIETYSGEMSGALMMESGGNATVSGALDDTGVVGSDPDQISISRSTARRAAIAGGMLLPFFGCAGLLGIGAVAGGAVWMLSQSGSQSEVQVATVPAATIPITAPPPTPEPVAVQQAPDLEPIPEPKETVGPGVENRMPTRRLSDAKVVGAVRLLGDATSVRLIGSEGTFEAGDVPVGVYRVKADFGAGLVHAGRVTVLGNTVHTVSCSSLFGTCTEQ